MKNCPFCNQPIKQEALKCHCCQRWLIDTSRLKSKGIPVGKIVWGIIIIYFIIASGCFSPLITKDIHNRIKPGMSAEQTIHILKNSYPFQIARHYFEINNTKVSEYYFLKETGITKRIIATYMGPAFNHNTFEIEFDQNGKVTRTTDVRHWD